MENGGNEEAYRYFGGYKDYVDTVCVVYSYKTQKKQADEKNTNSDM